MKYQRTSPNRHQSEWYEGIDIHHRFFEGMTQTDDGSWRIRWGS